MDALKVPGKGSGRVSVPIVAIRFNAGDDSVENVTVPSKPTVAASESLSGSPNHGADDSSWRKDFLQGSFFGRKRSGSIESTTASTATSATVTTAVAAPTVASNVPTQPLSSDTGGTWKLIKGKVSQAMEDIKSSKYDGKLCPTTSSTAVHIASEQMDDSDADSVTINSSFSEDLNDTPSTYPKSAATKGSYTDSDSDIDADLLMMSPDSDAYILKKSFDSLRSSSKKRSTRDTLLSKISKTKEEWRTAAASKPILRRRKKPAEVPANAPSSVDIESGVEITEEMTLSAAAIAPEPPKVNPIQPTDIVPTVPIAPLPVPRIAEPPIIQPSPMLTIASNLYRYRVLVVSIAAAVLCWLAAVPPFIQGIITCLCSMTLFNAGYASFRYECIRRLTSWANTSEQVPFAIPNYAQMPVCEIPAIEEHQSLKTYSGWMNEINNYDPANYHSSMTRSVFIKLDGSTLRISSTNARIPKRAIWNEPPIERKQITFTKHRTYDLIGCQIEMCPRGLARKRHYSRKYPIQLTIKNLSPLSRQDAEFTFDEVAEATSTNGTTAWESDSVASAAADPKSDIDFATTIMYSDLQKLQQERKPSGTNSTVTAATATAMPSGDDIRILLFARADREKEDWFRRFSAASIGAITDQELQFADMVFVNESDCVAALKAAATASTNSPIEKESVAGGEVTVSTHDDTNTTTNPGTTISSTVTDPKLDGKCDDSAEQAGTGTSETDSNEKKCRTNSLFEGLLMTSCAARGPSEYIKFMSRYQQACALRSIPVIEAYPVETSPKKNRRERKQEDELWKGIDQSLYLGPSGSVVWANVLVGRILFSCLNDNQLLGHIQEFLQKKLSAIKLPSFMEEVIIAQVNLGDTPPLVHRVSQPLIDERGTWIDADVTYEGLMHMTITTKLNLLRLKRQHNHHSTTSATPTTTASHPVTSNAAGGGSADSSGIQTPTPAHILIPEKSNDAIYDSNAESSGASSSESESFAQNNADLTETSQTGGGSSKKFLRIVDRITASNLFQSATEISYIQKAMENMSTKIRLRVELKGLVARCTINIPAPPSDRIWLGFRGPPRLWITATPAVGDHTFDWTMVTNAIESKLIDEVFKYLVYPNMIDMIVPFLGHSTYQE